MEISAILMGQRIRSARKAKEMSTEELAEKVGENQIDRDGTVPAWRIISKPRQLDEQKRKEQ